MWNLDFAYDILKIMYLGFFNSRIVGYWSDHNLTVVPPPVPAVGFVWRMGGALMQLGLNQLPKFPRFQQAAASVARDCVVVIFVQSKLMETDLCRNVRERLRHVEKVRNSPHVSEEGGVTFALGV